MATGAQLGKPAVNDPREFTLREVQQVVANIRERLRILDSTLSTVQTIQQVGTQTAAVDLAALKKQITNLSQELSALAAVVAGLDLGGETERFPQVEAQLAQLQRQVDDIDTVGDTANQAALLQRVQRQVDDLERSILI